MKRSKSLEIDYNPYKGKIVPKSNELIEKRTLFTRNQERIFSVALRELQNSRTGEVKLERHNLAEYLNYDTSNSFQKLAKDLSDMKAKSTMKFMDSNSKKYVDISVVTKVVIDKNEITIKFNDELLPKLTQLSRNYTKYFQDDFCSFRSKMSMKLYERLMELRIYAEDGVQFTTEQLFDIFCLDKDAYKDSRGIFQRGNFEKRTIKVAVEEINEKTKCINKLTYERLKKKGSRPVLYKFKFRYTHPNLPANVRSDPE